MKSPGLMEGHMKDRRCLFNDCGGMIDVVIPLLAGILIGANVGFVIAGLFGGNHDEDLPD